MLELLGLHEVRSVTKVPAEVLNCTSYESISEPLLSVASVQLITTLVASIATVGVGTYPGTLLAITVTDDDAKAAVP